MICNNNNITDNSKDNYNDSNNNNNKEKQEHIPADILSDCEQFVSLCSQENKASKVLGRITGTSMRKDMAGALGFKRQNNLSTPTLENEVFDS